MTPKNNYAYYCISLSFLIFLFPVETSFAHVKWFAPYDIAEGPLPMVFTMASPAFWIASSLTITFMLAAVWIEKSAISVFVGQIFDRCSALVYNNMDYFIRIISGAFFVSIFATGGVYFTPELTTGDEWVSWVQLIIALCVLFRATRVISAVGIVALLALSTRDYSAFHLIDYLPLQLALAAYFFADSVAGSKWYDRRFEFLRLGLAVGIMWSSIEKFAFTDWFLPILQEHPYLTMGIPAASFIQMAGVAEFAMGFGLLWTPFVRRLSALALIFIFGAAVIPFGRMDLVGHSLILAMAISVFADRNPYHAPFTNWSNPYTHLPLMAALSLVLFGSSYFGLHRVFNDPSLAIPGQLIAPAQASPMTSANRLLIKSRICGPRPVKMAQ